MQTLSCHRVGFAQATLAAIIAVFPALAEPGAFDTVINLPDDMVSLGGPVLGRTQVNVFSGGEILTGTIFGDLALVDDCPELNLFAGGLVGSGSGAANAQVNVLGGDLADFVVGEGGGLRVEAGSADITSFGNVTVELVGGELTVSAIGSQTISERSLLSVTGGTLRSDGSSSIFDVYAVADISGGDVQALLRFWDAATISGGTFQDGVNFLDTVDISGGTFQDEVLFGRPGVTISGGDFADVRSGPLSDTVITGGLLRDAFLLNTEVRGGRIGTYGNVYGFTKFGNEFEIDGVPTASDRFWAPRDSVISGTLEDGSVFIVTGSFGNDPDDNAPIVRVALPPVDTTPMTVTSGDVSPKGLRRGMSLTVDGTAVVPGLYPVIGSTVHIAGGTVEERFVAFDSDVTFSGGTVGTRPRAYQGTTFNIEGGTIGEQLNGRGDSQIFVSGGSVGNFALFEDTSTVTVTGGELGSATFTDDAELVVAGGFVASARLEDESHLEIEGGEIGDITISNSQLELVVSGGRVTGQIRGFNRSGRLIVRGGQPIEGIVDVGRVTFRGTQFAVEGVDVTALAVDGPYVVPDRAVTVSGMLEDGTPFEYFVEPSLPLPGQLLVGVGQSLVFEFVSNCAADQNGDGELDIDDFSAFVSNFFSGSTLADVNDDGSLDIDDFSGFVSAFFAGC